MSYEREQMVDARFHGWLRWPATVAAITCCAIVTLASRNLAAGLISGVLPVALLAILSGGGLERAARRHVRAEPRLLVADHTKLIEPGTRIALPEIRNDGESVLVRLRTRIRTIDVTVADEAEAEALVDAIGERAAPRTSFFLWRAPLPNWTELAFFLTLPGILVLLASLYWPVAIVPLICAASLAASVAVGVRLYRAQIDATVGVDGIALKQGAQPTHFIRHAQIRSVRAEGPEIVIATSGEEIRTSTTLSSETPEVDARYVQDIANRIERARSAAVALAAAPPETPGLLRGGRTIAEWLDSLRKIGEGGETAFRDAAPPRDQLWQIIESADAPAAERIAAAIALRTSGLSADEAPRLRIASDGAAEPKLGERLRVAEEGDDEALASVLEAAHRGANMKKLVLAFAIGLGCGPTTQPVPVEVAPSLAPLPAATSAPTRAPPPADDSPRSRGNDRDGDGIPDNLDKCPDMPEDMDGFQDSDGCPDPDNDGDGIPDANDKCPNNPETFNGREDTDGCPD